MSQPRLPFDPIDRAGDLWEEHFGDATAMRLATSVMRVQQLMVSALDGALKPFGLTFSRYEVLVLLHFSRSGMLPLSKIGERLMVHPTSVTSAIDRLEAQGYVERVADESDRRRTLARLTAEGQVTVKAATDAVTAIDFAITGLTERQQGDAYELLRRLRRAAGDFPA
ncbi:MarR family transcriptional regulator [Nocardioides sp. zg-ZUI104]|uniref:MarR family winged helix-turn-helix transcriptional regulator n=1 Tax=Nocardioides faecalis TaxID=2803858 RepID=UPI001BD188C5|nr:MarR family transcriptional regulator [Nocardioides faecalis]MBS4752942.1 MarR family transcriptional regulator [Nocardioides faecalis]